jgi:indole-3-glycerol phosphate synthase
VPPTTLRDLLHVARELALEVLLEIRDEGELELALELEARVIGINNRNLETLAIDAGTSDRLLNRVPCEVVAIAESGVSVRTDVERTGRAGADAVLVGSAVSAAKDPTAAVRALTGVPRTSRER